MMIIYLVLKKKYIKYNNILSIKKRYIKFDNDNKIY